MTTAGTPRSRGHAPTDPGLPEARDHLPGHHAGPARRGRCCTTWSQAMAEPFADAGRDPRRRDRGARVHPGRGGGDRARGGVRPGAEARASCPGSGWQRSTTLEYGTDALGVPPRRAGAGHARVLVVDDVLATGGTARAAGAAGPEAREPRWWAGSFLLEIAWLGGPEKLQRRRAHVLALAVGLTRACGAGFRAVVQRVTIPAGIVSRLGGSPGRCPAPVAQMDRAAVS